MLSFLFRDTNIIQINYDSENKLTHIYLLEKEDDKYSDLVLYEFDIYDIIKPPNHPVDVIEGLLEEFYFEDYETLERLSKKKIIGKMNAEQFGKFLSLNNIIELDNMTEVSERMFENSIERLMIQRDNFDDDYFFKIIHSISEENGFDCRNKTIDENVLEKITGFQKVEEDMLDKRMNLSEEFINDLLIDKEQEVYISYQYLCRILIDQYIIMCDVLADEELYQIDNSSK